MRGVRISRYLFRKIESFNHKWWGFLFYKKLLPAVKQQQNPYQDVQSAHGSLKQCLVVAHHFREVFLQQ